MKLARKDVMAVAGSKLTGGKKRDFLTERTKEYGGLTYKKKKKINYKHLLGMKKKNKERKVEDRERLQEMGMYQKPKKRRGLSAEEFRHKKLGNRRGESGVMTGERGLSGSVGKYKDGVLYINPELIKNRATGGRGSFSPSKEKHQGRLEQHKSKQYSLDQFKKHSSNRDGMKKKKKKWHNK